MKVDGLGRGWLFFKTEKKKAHSNEPRKSGETARRVIQISAMKSIFVQGFPVDNTFRCLIAEKVHFKMLLADSLAFVSEGTLVNRGC